MARKTILNDKPGILIEKYYKALLAAGLSVEKLILFGSYARGNPKPWSDLDICVVSKGFGKDRFEERVYLTKLASSIEPLIEPHPYHPKDLKNRWDVLAVEILKHGKVINTSS